MNANSKVVLAVVAGVGLGALLLFLLYRGKTLPMLAPMRVMPASPPSYMTTSVQRDEEGLIKSYTTERPMGAGMVNIDFSPNINIG